MTGKPVDGDEIEGSDACVVAGNRFPVDDAGARGAVGDYPDSIDVAMNARVWLNRSSLAMTTLALCLLKTASAAGS